jgi:hypothetical protein
MAAKLHQIYCNKYFFGYYAFINHSSKTGYAKGVTNRRGKIRERSKEGEYG